MLHVPDTLHTGPYILQHAFGFLYQRKVTHISEYKPNYSDKNYHRHVNPYRIKHGLEPFEQSRVLSEETRKEALKILQSHGIEGLVIIGGDGSLTGGSLLSDLGMPIVGLPGTIDNDVWGSDYTIGADTALNTILDAINKLRDTASAHRRIIVLEVMGRKCGWLAMMAGIAGGAEYVLVPEVKYDLNKICDELKTSYDNGRRYSIVVVAEGVGSAVDIGKEIGEKTGIDTRVTVLGHVQRGGSPTAEDRVKASMLGEKAALALLNGQSNIVFGINEGKVVAIDLHDSVNNNKTLDPELVRLARVLSK